MKLQQRIVWALAGAMIAVAANCVSTAPVAAQDDSNLLCRLGVNVFHQRPSTFDLPALRAVGMWTAGRGPRPRAPMASNTS